VFLGSEVQFATTRLTDASSVQFLYPIENSIMSQPGFSSPIDPHTARGAGTERIDRERFAGGLGRLALVGQSLDPVPTD
jgi:hypothetical protein